ncbi:hypothetical protein OQA88_8787 [Cercophora sp. LCS_1]
MDPLSPDAHRGPQIYVHVEFGVSWTKKPPKNHEMTYRSRNMRERTPHFPRQVPAPNTNYLAAIRDFDQRQTQTRTRSQTAVAAAAAAPARGRNHTEILHLRPDDPRHYHQMQEYYRPPPPPYQENVSQEARPTRADSRSSHERGHSAPPPIGDNPWDVNISRRQDSGGEPSSNPRPPADHWKALPAEPSQFRLGEGGMPWSAWSWPLEYHPETPTRSHEEMMSTRSGPEPYATSPTMVSTFSPETSTSRQPTDERGIAREAAALGAAMMTVDNGFENQWWNQGRKEVVTTSILGATSGPLGGDLGMGDGSVEEMGWSAVAPSEGERHSRGDSSIVSPLSASASPQPGFGTLHRSLSTRSEELFFLEGR